MSRPPSRKRSYTPEPWRIKTVEAIRLLPTDERLRALGAVGFNVSMLRSDDVFIDLYTDSGTNAMSDRQWAAMMIGDEAYSGARSFYRLEEAIQRYYGYPHVIPTHQGRAAENLISRLLIRSGQHVFGNMYFTTTRLHQELNGATFHDVVIPEAHQSSSDHPFKGDVDIDHLRKLIAEFGAEDVAYLSIAATVNMAGGQPISLANLREVRAVADEFGIPIILDAARAVENAWFIQSREEGMAGRSVAEILFEICSLTDGAVMSAKKDSYANIGGWLAVRDPDLADRARNLVVVYKGLHTYGGMAGRDMEAVAQGIEESVDEANITARIGQVHYLGGRLLDSGVPVTTPIGGHGVYLDANAILPHVPEEEFRAQTLAALLYARAGIRGAERGAVSAGRDANGANRFPELELVRLTIPRRAYTQSHMDYVADAVIDLVADAPRYRRGLAFTYEPDVLRFFQARFEPLQADAFAGPLTTTQ